ncbi:MAG: DNA-binding protein [Rhodoferax sp.]
MKIEEFLNQEYGPLLSIVQLAKVLNRSPEGLRISLRTPSEWSDKINETKLKLGRRVYYRTAEISVLLSGQ